MFQHYLHFAFIEQCAEAHETGSRVLEKVAPVFGLITEVPYRIKHVPQ